MNTDLVDLYGEEYVRNFEVNQSRERLRRLLPLIRHNQQSKVADYACGSGMMLEHLATRVKEYVGVDFSQQFIEAANRNKERLHYTNAKFLCMRIEDFCTDYPAYFDIALALDVSEHIPDDDWIATLVGIRNSLQPHGKLYVHTPNGEFFLEIMKSSNFIIKQFKEHIAVRTLRHNIEILNKAGFTKVEPTFLPHYNLLRYVHPMSFLPMIGKYFQARIFITAYK